MNKMRYFIYIYIYFFIIIQFNWNTHLIFQKEDIFVHIPYNNFKIYFYFPNIIFWNSSLKCLKLTKTISLKSNFTDLLKNTKSSIFFNQRKLNMLFVRVCIIQNFLHSERCSCSNVISVELKVNLCEYLNKLFP